MKKIALFLALISLLFYVTACRENSVSIPDQPAVSPANSSGSSSSVYSSEICYTFIEESSSSEETETSSSAFIEESSSSEETNTSSLELSAPPPPAAPEIITPCKASVFYSVDDKEFLLKENHLEAVAPASITKLLTASVALSYMSPDEVITVGSELNLVKPNSSLCWLVKGHRLKLYDLLTGMLVASGNDAAYTVAVSVARAESGNSTLSDAEAAAYFSRLMNEHAKRIGMKNSNFVNPDGWDDEEQRTTASDLLKLAEYALSVPEIREITSIREKQVIFESGHIINWKNSNKLLDPNSRFYSQYAVGLKTGTTSDAGACLIAAFEKGGKTYISVVMGCESDTDRYMITTENFSKLA